MKALNYSVFRFVRSPMDEERLRLVVMIDGIGGFQIDYEGKKNMDGRPFIVKFDDTWTTKKFIKVFGFFVHQSDNEAYRKEIMPLVDGYLSKHFDEKIRLSYTPVPLPTRIRLREKGKGKRNLSYTTYVVRDRRTGAYREDRRMGTFITTGEMIDWCKDKNVIPAFDTSSYEIDDVDWLIEQEGGGFH